MATSLSTDLRERLISAVESGQSCRAAAKRFGVAASTAIKWVSRWRAEGHAEARPRGGDRHSHRMEALRKAPGWHRPAARCPPAAEDSLPARPGRVGSWPGPDRVPLGRRAGEPASNPPHPWPGRSRINHRAPAIRRRCFWPRRSCAGSSGGGRRRFAGADG